MADFEIRYFYADGTLALVRLTTQSSASDAEEQAKLNQEGFACFELRQVKPARA